MDFHLLTTDLREQKNSTYLYQLTLKKIFLRGLRVSIFPKWCKTKKDFKSQKNRGYQSSLKGSPKKPRRDGYLYLSFFGMGLMIC